MGSDDQINILLVDDQPRNLLALEAVLANPQYRLVRANSGDEALKALLRDDFAVILMDVMMPGMDGFETGQLVRSRDRTRYTPIIYVTAVGTSDTHVARGYAVGAVDYLFKPIVPEILRSKVAAFAEMFRKTEAIKRQEQHLRELERREHVAKLAEAEQRLAAQELRYEMELAREIQQHLFPEKPPKLPRLEIAGASVPANAAGGDYFDYIAAGQGLLDVVVADVAGHGVGPALLMAATRAYIRSTAPRCRTPAEVLSEVNRAHSRDSNKFITLLIARIAEDPLSLIYASAGHNPGYLLNASGAVKAELSSTGMPLGIDPDADFENSPKIPLDPGDLIFLYTDGVVEAAAPDEDAFGVDRALEVVRRSRRQPTAEIVGALQSAVSAFTQTGVRQDDITVVVLRVMDGIAR